MRRRGILGLAAGGAATLLAGCGESRASVRYRVIATAEVDGQPVQGSTVMQVEYWRITHSLVGYGGGTALYGEALILDLKGRGTVFLLPFIHSDHTVLIEIYEPGILRTFGIRSSIGSLSDDDFARLRQIKGRRPFSFAPFDPPLRLPAFVAFRDEHVPNTIYEVDPQQMDRFFPGVRFVGLDIEITDAPVTRVLKQRLPWLASPTSSFDRDPPGHLRPAKDQPIGYKITNAHFFGKRSQ